MRSLAARLLAPASSHASLRAAPVFVRSGIATLDAPSAQSTAWRCQYRQQPHARISQQRRKLCLTTSLSESSSQTTTTTPSPPTPAAYPPLDDEGRLDPSAFRKLPFRFDTGIALFAKRAPRPFPPPFLSPPSGSFSDPLSTHDRSRDRRDRRRAYVGGRMIQGFTNGDDAVFASEYFVCANDGVGAWSTRPRGHAGLWARLILHFWATAIFEDAARQGESYRPDPVAYLQRAYEQTVDATSAPNDWQGTTTAAGAQLHYRRRTAAAGSGEEANSSSTDNQDGGHDRDDVEPLLYVTNLGDSQVMVVRPSTREVVYKTAEQWHWFDCPRQLGTNSPDTPRHCAVVDEVLIREGDVVLAMSDGVIDNLWTHEIVEKVSESLAKWQAGEVEDSRRGVVDADGGSVDGDDGGMGYVAEELMEAARVIAVDPFAESPFMEHAIEEGLASHGGKLDDISVVAALCRRNDG